MAYEQLEKALESAGKTRKDLADVLGRDRAIATNLFNGKRRLTIEESYRLADWLNISVGIIADRPRNIPVLGYVGAGQEVLPMADMPKCSGFSEALRRGGSISIGNENH